MNHSNNHEVSDNWQEMKVTIKNRWRKHLSNKEINKIKGKKRKLLEALMNKFECTKYEAEEELQEFWH